MRGVGRGGGLSEKSRGTVFGGLGRGLARGGLKRVRKGLGIGSFNFNFLLYFFVFNFIANKIYKKVLTGNQFVFIKKSWPVINYFVCLFVCLLFDLGYAL